jgi:hypothetical protein
VGPPKAGEFGRHAGVIESPILWSYQDVGPDTRRTIRDCRGFSATGVDDVGAIWLI